MDYYLAMVIVALIYNGRKFAEAWLNRPKR
jgi:hypothetical protein